MGKGKGKRERVRVKSERYRVRVRVRVNSYVGDEQVKGKGPKIVELGLLDNP